MQKVIIISTCIRRKKEKAHFHFIGFYMGVKIRRVQLIVPASMEIVENAVYMLEVEVSQCSQGTLKGVILRAKNIDDVQLC